MIKTVVLKGDRILRKHCLPVRDFVAVAPLVQDLRDTIAYLKTTYEFKRGIGLAAPQIGINQCVSVAEYEGKQYVLINPIIIAHSGEKKQIREGCISFFEYRAEVPRFDYVKVSAKDLEGKQYSVEGKGDFAMLLQHEIDHLSGILYIDHLPRREKDLIRVK